MSELASLKKQRSTMKGKLTNILKTIATFDNKTDLEDVRTRLNRVESLLVEFTAVEGKLFNINHEEDADLEFEKKYYTAKTQLNAFIRKRSMIPGSDIQVLDTTLNTSHVGQAEVKLPKINIPQFSGDYTEWQSFFDLFSTTIHESMMLNPVQKFQYLKGSLTGEAAALLRHISVTESNYLEALNKLKERYDRKKHIITSFIRTFMEHPPLHNANATKMKYLLDSADEIVRGLKALGPTAESRDPWLIYILVSKLDDKSKCSWAETSAAKENPTLGEFFKFLQLRIDALESINASSKSGNVKTPIKSHVVSNETAVYTCVFCKEDNHSIFDCAVFNSLDVTKRKEWIKQARRCFNCFSTRHPIFRCISNRRCQICSRKHNTLLHVNEAEVPASSSMTNEATNKLNSSIAKCSDPESKRFQSILPTAQITVSDSYGTPHICRALLDSGSQASFITEACVQRLNLKRINSRILVNGLGSTKAGYTRGLVSVPVQPIGYPRFEINALVLSKITSNVPPQEIMGVPNEVWTMGQLADPAFTQPNTVDLLIGADHFFKLLLDGRQQLNSDGPILQNTMFGWVVSGTCQEGRNSSSTLLVTNNESETNLDVILKRFWEIESVGVGSSIRSSEEEYCEQHFKENTIRNENGRFVTRLPFIESPDDLSNTLNIAILRLRNMERRFERDQEFKTLYHQFIHEYEQLQHMERIPETEISNEGYYLPHHGVLKNTSTTTKLRVVFDGSAKGNTGHSINQYLAVGPTIQSSLYAIILRFREHKIAISADVEKMYRQVAINNEDTKFQKILWRKHPSDPIGHYRLLTVTYGLASAPFLAIRCLKQITEEQKKLNPTACQEIAKNIYVDDLMTAVDTKVEGLQLQKDISSILKEYGFLLRKWSSNCREILTSAQDLREPGTVKEIHDTSDESSPYVKLLGVNWNPRTDEFTFKASLQSHAQITKRTILSDASKLFDPLGWLAPIVVKKIFMQTLWIQNLGWDEVLPIDQKQHWDKIQFELNDVEHLSIPRFIQFSIQSKVDIHGLCDASESAYAAVVYYRITTPGKNVIVEIMTAKTKVAPIKQVSLPRLELCGAVLLTKLIETVKHETSLQISNIYTWTDSKIVLDWLANEPRRWTTFIANRTSTISDTLPRSHWRHVPSSQNPADPASRGVFASELRELDLWWKGPQWLKLNEEHWPFQKGNYGYIHEERPTKLATFIGLLPNDTLDNMLIKYSSYFKFQRVLAFVIRFVTNLKSMLNKVQPTHGIILKPQELAQAFHTICKFEQTKSYTEEIAALTREGSINRSSSLASLNPFLDESGLLRVGGRLENSEAPYSTKHPVILPPKSILTRLILEELHDKYSHAGPSLLLSIFRQRYWSTGGRAKVREIVRNCVVCKRYQATLQTQMMGNLPPARVELIRPFLKTGIDFAGPVSIHLTKGRGQRTYKAYICVFVCLSIKAVHLELVGDLTSESFIAALKRFVARRGVPSEIHSDNGTNFVGANNQIREEIEKIIKNCTNFSQFLSSNTISWQFIPPNAPHFGGIWEAAVKSTKFHLKRVIGKTILTMEEMTTLLAEIESCLNSRPICVLAADQIDTLTPGHFLVGHPLAKIPELDITHVNINYLSRWKMVKQIQQHFWNRWRNEYLTSLQARTKWKYSKESLKVNDVVIINDNMPINQWLLGKVTHLHPGADGVVRVVTLKTKSGELKRPIQKLCLLPVYPNTDTINLDKSSNNSAGKTTIEPGGSRAAVCRSD